LRSTGWAAAPLQFVQNVGQSCQPDAFAGLQTMLLGDLVLVEPWLLSSEQTLTMKKLHE
jgi:hypothetical protein